MSMRRGAATTARALAEQATAGEQISRSAVGLRTMIGAVTRAMAEQSKAMSEIAAASEGMRTQAEQTSRAVKEQARTMKDMTGAAHNTLKQIKLITHANREHSTVSASLLASLGEVRQITDRNVSWREAHTRRHRRSAAPGQRAGRPRRAAGEPPPRQRTRVTDQRPAEPETDVRHVHGRFGSRGAHVGSVDRDDHRNLSGSGTQPPARGGGAGARDARAASR